MKKIKIEDLIITEFWPTFDNPVAVKVWIILSYCSVEYFKKVCNKLGLGCVRNGHSVVIYQKDYS